MFPTQISVAASSGKLSLFLPRISNSIYGFHRKYLTNIDCNKIEICNVKINYAHVHQISLKFIKPFRRYFHLSKKVGITCGRYIFGISGNSKVRDQHGYLYYHFEQIHHYRTGNFGVLCGPPKRW